VNGLNLYYETHGPDGTTPLVLLHGGVGSGGMFGEMLAQLAAGRRAIPVDLQGHGRTADIDRPLNFEAMADDVAGLIRHLGLAKADIMGYSLGGGVALQTAIRHPDVVRRLVIISAPAKRDGWYPEVLAGMAGMTAEAAEAMKPSPIYQHYASIAPRPEDWPVLVGKLGELLRQDYDWSQEVAALSAPVLIVVGDADSVRTAHAVEFFELLGGGKRDAGWDGSGMSRSRLAILPGTTHYSILSSPGLAATADRFLEAPMAG
jgi:pimeloyl-ACP methyl ester carboxylesterase